MQVKSPISGEMITMPRRPAAAPDISGLQKMVDELSERIGEIEERERTNVKELSGYAFRAMEAALQARDHKPASVPAADPQVAALRTVIDSMQSKLNEMCASMDEYREAESTKVVTPAPAQVDMTAIASLIKHELAQAPKYTGDMFVDVVDRDLNGNAKTFKLRKGVTQ